MRRLKNVFRVHKMALGVLRDLGLDEVGQFRGELRIPGLSTTFRDLGVRGVRISGISGWLVKFRTFGFKVLKDWGVCG